MDMFRAGLLTLALVSLECAHGTRQEPISFSKDVRPILKENCVLCHSAEVRMGGVALDSFEHLMSSRYLNRPTPFVIPGDPNRSRSSLWFIPPTQSSGCLRLLPGSTLSARRASW